MTSTIIEGPCPTCGTVLTSAPEQAPWCAGCEWNLDHFPDEPGYSWFWNKIAAADRRAGFRSDRLLAESTDAEPVGRTGFRFLLAVSAVLMAVVVAGVAGGLWLIIAGGSFWSVVSGLVLLALAAVLRPRFNRLKPLLENSYRVERTDAPTVYALIDRIAERVDAPRPDIVLFDFGWNAGVLTVGPRPQRVLIVGVRLLLALRPQEVVALLGHELGHLKYSDTRRLMLTMPARTAGSEAALYLADVLAMLPELSEYVQHHVPKGEAAMRWRRMLRTVQERESAGAPARRQLSIRTGASLFASHPAPGRRHQWLAARPAQSASVFVTEGEAETLEQEIKPYAEALHRTMLKAIVHD
ncbi:M48 family metallopeptidase [Actinoplanes solisilvae]|uniref:M48 family metallopeptidase n=1 Tax=Actinoplanes solisilvae TaxID=2486853 RepID=UPI000FD93572|nr:M48 family metallopeptidase [Actinoplanes solisilvae]